MDSLRLRATVIADFGDVIAIQGRCEATGQTVAVHIDQRPHQPLWSAWLATGGVEPVMFEAADTVLRIELIADADPTPGGVQATLPFDLAA
jgi:hypothetical protein